MTNLFRTKVCGIKTSVDFMAAIDSRVDAIGLNFVPESPRFISLDDAAKICQEFRSQLTQAGSGSNRLKLVGVFVNPTPDYVRQVLRIVPLDYVQLHGEEKADEWRDFEDLPLIKAVGWSASHEQIIALTRWHQFLGARLAAFLVDAASTEMRGGSGLKADWNSLVPRPPVLAGKPLILAGGLRPDNVSSAIVSVMPNAVDTASGVEKMLGVKDALKMKQFVVQANQAWKQLRLQ